MARTISTAELLQESTETRVITRWGEVNFNNVGSIFDPVRGKLMEISVRKKSANKKYAVWESISLDIELPWLNENSKSETDYMLVRRQALDIIAMLDGAFHRGQLAKIDEIKEVLEWET